MKYDLILKNDNKNSFQNVIESLIKRADVSLKDAEQIAETVHVAGFDVVTTGKKEKIEKIAKKMKKDGLTIKVKKEGEVIKPQPQSMNPMGDLMGGLMDLMTSNLERMSEKMQRDNAGLDKDEELYTEEKPDSMTQEEIDKEGLIGYAIVKKEDDEGEGYKLTKFKTMDEYETFKDMMYCLIEGDDYLKATYTIIEENTELPNENR